MNLFSLSKTRILYNTNYTRNCELLRSVMPSDGGNCQHSLASKSRVTEARKLAETIVSNVDDD